MRVNFEIRAPKVRVIGAGGDQLGVMTIQEALHAAQEAGLDLVEIVATSTPPVCKIIDHGKFRYDQAKREKESKKSQHQIKVKEVKISPNISENDFDVKVRHAREFLEKGNKVKFTCMFRGREIMHPELGDKHMKRAIELLNEIAVIESNPKMLGKILSMILAASPNGKKKKLSGGQTLQTHLQEALSEASEKKLQP
ncbi:MAG: translation initiation factor IF-3 [Chlamydia sp.]